MTMVNYRLAACLSEVIVATSILSCISSDPTELPSKHGSLQELTYSTGQSTFSLWAPTADSARVLLYGDGQTGEPFRILEMKKNPADGSWNATASGDQAGRFYTFRVNISGRWLEETPGIFATAVGVNGKRAAIIDMDSTDPDGWDQDRRPELLSPSDAVIYEMHHRDFSISGNSGISPEHRGKFLALTETGTRGPQGAKTGIDHLKELGVTHVHILPSFDYASVDETRLQDSTYNWGYDPVNYNVPEGSYSTDPYTPEVRIREFKEMVQALHKAGIRVVLDVVYNHVSNAASHAFERTVPGYFFRMRDDGSFADGSACGNETASERPMMRRYMTESIRWWAEEYHIDGFRFDLMGIHDTATMNAIRAAADEIDPSILIYGEGWAASAPLYDASRLAMKANTWQMPGIAAFSDEMRDALRGPFSDDAKAGFLGGEPGLEESIRFGVTGGILHPGVNYSAVNYSDTCWAGQPSQLISYISCHDDMCLRDRLQASIPGITEEELIRLDKLGQTVVFTSQGIPFIYAGEEIFRTKQGVRNSFNSPDSINAIDWTFKSRYSDLYGYYRGLIALRKAHPAFRLGDADLVREHLEFLQAPSGTVAWRLTGHAGGDPCEEIIVIVNSRKEPVTLEIPAYTPASGTPGKASGNKNVIKQNAETSDVTDPEISQNSTVSSSAAKEYTVYCRDGAIDVDGLGKITGPVITVGPQQALIIGR